MAHSSQAANIRHRIEDLPYRLSVEKWRKGWKPKKRTQPSRQISTSRKAIQDTRRLLREKIPIIWVQHEHEDNKDQFFKRLAPLINRYQSLYQTKLPFAHQLKVRLRIRDRVKRIRSMVKAAIQRIG